MAHISEHEHNWRPRPMVSSMQGPLPKWIIETPILYIPWNNYQLEGEEQHWAKREIRIIIIIVWIV